MAIQLELFKEYYINEVIGRIAQIGNAQVDAKEGDLVDSETYLNKHKTINPNYFA